MTFVGAAFFFAFFGLVGLFALKRWEHLHGSILFPEIRQRADEQALRFKAMLASGLRNFGRLPHILVYLLRIGVHVAAVAFGHLAHWIGERSHDLADLVSHKHRFERRETRSEFLKQVIEHPISNRFPASVDNSPVADSLIKHDSNHITPHVPSSDEKSAVEHELVTKSALVAPVKKKRARRVTKKTVKNAEAPIAGEDLDR